MRGQPRPATPRPRPACGASAGFDRFVVLLADGQVGTPSRPAPLPSRPSGGGAAAAGVGAQLASSSRKCCRVCPATSWTLMPSRLPCALASRRSSRRPAPVSGVEQFADAGAMQGDLQGAEADRAEHGLAVTLLAPLSMMSMPSMPAGGVAWRRTAGVRASRCPASRARQAAARRRRRSTKHDLRVLASLRARAALSDASIAVGMNPKRCPIASAEAFCARASVREVMATSAPSTCQHGGGAHADRAGAGQHHGLLAGQRHRLGEQGDRRRRRWCWSHCCPASPTRGNRRRSFLHRLEQSLAGGHIAAADEDRGVLSFLRRARVNGAVHQRRRRFAALTPP